MKKLWLGLGLLVGSCGLAHAQQVQVLSGGCGTAAPTSGQNVLYVDTHGNLCSSATSSGGTVTTQATAGSSVPTYSAGAQNLSQNLSGGLRVNLSQAGTDLGIGSQTSAASLPVVIASDQVPVPPSASSGIGLTAVSSTAAEGTHVLKNGAGNLYSVYVTTGGTAGYLMVFNATSAPGDGAVTPVHCVSVAANTTQGLSFGSGPPGVFSTGISVAFSSTGCFTKTASATAFFAGSVK